MARIKEILQEKNMTVAELATKLGVSRQALSRQMKGKMLIETAERIASALDVPMWQLFAFPTKVRQYGYCRDMPALRCSDTYTFRCNRLFGGADTDACGFFLTFAGGLRTKGNLDCHDDY